jgi:hypothetical protein
MEDATGGSYSMIIDSAAQARQVVRISNLGIFNASTNASKNSEGTSISLSMNGTGDYRSKLQVLGGLKNHPIGESDMKVIGSVFEINSTLRYLL